MSRDLGGGTVYLGSGRDPGPEAVMIGFCDGILVRQTVEEAQRREEEEAREFSCRTPFSQKGAIEAFNRLRLEFSVTAADLEKLTGGDPSRFGLLRDRVPRKVAAPWNPPKAKRRKRKR